MNGKNTCADGFSAKTDFEWETSEDGAGVVITRYVG